MSLPDGFQFSQSSLQAFETCPRRFKLRYVQRLNWPGLKSEPIQEAERLAQLGTDFHRLVQQHQLGLEAELLTTTLTEAEPDLKQWWDSYLAHHSAMLKQAETYPELTLSAPLRDYRIMARFDLLALQKGGDFLIVDWKTTQQKPSHANLARRIQTRLYPYILATAGHAFNKGDPIDPALIKMIYWYPQAPQEPETFPYSTQQYQWDEQFLSGLIEQIKTAAQKDDFPLVENVQPCLHCTYRSYCNRGDKPGPAPELVEDSQADIEVMAFDWEQIAEVQF